MHSQLLDLPLNLTIELLGSWLSLKDLALLDAAQCNRCSREVHLDALQSDGLIVDISSYENEMAQLMEWIEDRKVKIERVNLRNGGWQIGPGHIASFLGSVGSNLLDLSADNSEGYLTHTCCIAIASCPRLKVLHVSRCNDDNTEGTICRLIAQRAATLERLALEDSISYNVLPKYTEMKKLQYLAILDSAMSKRNLSAFLCTCRKLLYFYLVDFGGCDDLLLALADSCPCLRSLHYGRAAAHSTAGLEAVLLACKDLHTVDFTSAAGFGNAHVKLIAQHCRKLQALRFHLDDEGITEECIAILTPRLAELRHLAVVGMECADDAPLQLLIRHCRQLRSLSLRRLQGDLNENVVTQLFRSLPDLEELNMAEYLLTDEMMLAIGKNCPHLRVLNLYETSDFYTGRGIGVIATGCAALETVIVSDDEPILNEHVQNFWQAFRPTLRFRLEGAVWTRWNNFRDNA